MSNEAGVFGVKVQPEVASMARKGMKVECGHCSFVARTAAAMEEHMKEHDMDKSDCYPGDTAYGTLHTYRSTQQECLATGCQNVDSIDTSFSGHHNEVLHGETKQTQYVACQYFKDGVLCERSETQLDRTQDKLDDEQGRIRWLQHMTDDEHIDELSQNDINEMCQLKITEVRSITDETDNYSGNDHEEDCSADTPIQIMSIRSIKQDTEFHCKKEPLDDQETKPQMGFGDVGAKIDDVCATVAPDAIKQEPRDDSPLCWGAYQPVSSSHVSMSRDRPREMLQTAGGEDAREDGGVGDLSFACAPRQWSTYFDIANSAEKKDVIDVVGFCDSDVDSATDCAGSLTETVQLSLWRIKRRRCSSGKVKSSLGDGEASCGFKDADRAASLSAVAPNLFAALTKPGADVHGKTPASDSENDEKRPFDYQDHTYAHIGRPGSLTCARVRSYDEVALSARAKRQLRRRRAPTTMAWTREIYASTERQTTVNKRKQPDKIVEILEALSPTKNSTTGDTTRTSEAAADSPGQGSSSRKRPTAKSAGKALPSPGETSQYVCTICSSSFRTRTAFCSHVINCHKEVGGRLYYCAYCKYLAMDIGLVKSHMDEVHGDRATRVIAAGLDNEMKVAKDRKETVPVTTMFAPVRVSNRVLHRNKTAQLKAHVNPGAFVEAVVTRKRKKWLKKPRNRRGNPPGGVVDDELGYAETAIGCVGGAYPLDALRDVPIKNETAVTSGPYQSNRKARKSQSTGRLRTRYTSPETLSSVGIQKSPSTTPTSPDSWQKYSDDDGLDDCVPELVDDTCCEMFENSLLSLEWDERETLGLTLYGVPDPFETANVGDAPGKVVSVKQEPLDNTFGDSSNGEQRSRRYSRRMRKPKRPYCMCGSCDEEYTISPTTRPQETLSDVDHAKTLAAAAGDMSYDSLLSEMGDKMVGLPWAEDPKLRMTPIVLLCDIVIAILAGGGGYT